MSSAAASRDVLVYIFLRGGLDGLQAVPPHGDADLYSLRPTIAIPPPGQPGGAIDLDGFFGLNPSASDLMLPYNNGDLAIVQASGSTDPTRSHFDSMRFIEWGIPKQPKFSVSSGWLSRHLATVSAAPSATLRALALGKLIPLSLTQAPQSLAIADPVAFDFPGDPHTRKLRRHLMQAMYTDLAPPVGTAGTQSIATIDVLERVDFAGYQPSHGATYPKTDFGRRIKNAATLIKAKIGVEAISVDVGEWDTHNDASRRMAKSLRELAQALKALYLDLGARWLNRTTVIVQSEFGRKAAENAAGGADHGHGGVMMVMGGNVHGGRVFSQWPGLAPHQLDLGDLAVTIDFRDVVGEVLAKRIGNTRLDVVFPHHTPAFPGIVR